MANISNKKQEKWLAAFKKGPPKSTKSVFVLESWPEHFYSPMDETAFFEWLKRIPCVLDFIGFGHVLYVRISRRKLNQRSMEELLACFFRYKRNMKQFAELDRKEYSSWFRNKDAYWHKAVFTPAANKQPAHVLALKHFRKRLRK